MVNYCCVNGCGRNSKSNNQLNFYTFPKEPERQVQWLSAANRSDLLPRVLEGPPLQSYRICSRHFAEADIKNRKLNPNAVPTLCLSGSENVIVEKETQSHSGIICNNCNTDIKGYRYKCVTCADYDLCMKCETRELHPEHFMLRISRNILFEDVNELVNKWRIFFKSEHVDVRTQQLDVKKATPKNVHTNYLSEDVKIKIIDEVSKVLKLKGKREFLNNITNKEVKKKTNNKTLQNHGVACGTCSIEISGFRYKCISCDDYDLCNDCEWKQNHDQHYMLRIAKCDRNNEYEDLIPICRDYLTKSNVHVEISNDGTDEELIKRCREYMTKSNVPVEASDEESDNEPITKYLKLKEEPQTNAQEAIFFQNMEC